MKAIFVSGLLVAGHILLDHTIGSNHWLKQFAASTGEYDQELRGHKHFFIVFIVGCTVMTQTHCRCVTSLSRNKEFFFGRIANAIPEVVGTSVL